MKIVTDALSATGLRYTASLPSEGSMVLTFDSSSDAKVGFHLLKATSEITPMLLDHQQNWVVVSNVAATPEVAVIESIQPLKRLVTPELQRLVKRLFESALPSGHDGIVSTYPHFLSAIDDVLVQFSDFLLGPGNIPNPDKEVPQTDTDEEEIAVEVAKAKSARSKFFSKLMKLLSGKEPEAMFDAFVAADPEEFSKHLHNVVSMLTDDVWKRSGKTKPEEVRVEIDGSKIVPSVTPEVRLKAIEDTLKTIQLSIASQASPFRYGGIYAGAAQVPTVLNGTLSVGANGASVFTPNATNDITK